MPMWIFIYTNANKGKKKFVSVLMKRKQIFSIFEIKYCETQFLINK